MGQIRMKNEQLRMIGMIYAALATVSLVLFGTLTGFVIAGKISPAILVDDVQKGLAFVVGAMTATTGHLAAAFFQTAPEGAQPQE